MVEAFERRLVVGMPEPVLVAQGGIGFDRAPVQVPMTVNDVPILVGNLAAFVAYPACVAVFKESCIGEDDGVGLVSAQSFNDLIEVIDVASAARAIEPEFNQVAVIRCKFS